LSHSKNTTL